MRLEEESARVVNLVEEETGESADAVDVVEEETSESADAVESDERVRVAEVSDEGVRVAEVEKNVAEKEPGKGLNRSAMSNGAVEIDELIGISMDEYAEKWQKGRKDAVSDGIFTLMGKLLFFTERREKVLRLCVPKGLVGEVLVLCHDRTGHPGIRRTMESTRMRYYFPKMSRKIRRYVNECAPCQTSKHSNEPAAGLLYPIRTDEPLYTVAIDFVTALPKSYDGYDSILSITDKYTKAIRIVPCTSTITAEDTAKLYIRQVMPFFGLPEKIISDRDPKFTSRFWRELMKVLGVRLGLTAAFHPAADGQSERTNQTVEIMLRCFIAGDLEKYPLWTDWLPVIESEYNATPHHTTGFSPNRLRYCMDLKGIPDLASTSDPIASQEGRDLADELLNRRDEVRDSISVAQRKMKRLTDQHRSKKEFEVGDLVLIKYSRLGPGYRPPRSHRHKIAPTSTPVRIIEKLSPLSYRVDLPAGSRIHDVLSIVHLRRFNGVGEDIRPLPVLEEGSGDKDVFEVEEIQGEKRDGAENVFLVKWKGYPDEESTWEPESHLLDAPEAVMAWRAKKGSHKSKPQPSSAEELPSSTSESFPSRSDSVASPRMDDPPLPTVRRSRRLLPLPPAGLLPTR